MPYPKIIREGYKEFVICPISRNKILINSNQYKYNFDLQQNDFIGNCCRGSSDPDSERNCPYHISRGVFEGIESIKCKIPAEELHDELFK